MKDQKRLFVLLGVLGCGIALAVAVRLLSTQEPAREVPRGVTYYTGPMKAKFADRWGSEDGKATTRAEAEEQAKRAQETLGR